MFLTDVGRAAEYTVLMDTTFRSRHVRYQSKASGQVSGAYAGDEADAEIPGIQIPGTQYITIPGTHKFRGHNT